LGYSGQLAYRQSVLNTRFKFNQNYKRTYSYEMMFLNEISLGNNLRV
jgi:hypothetical protein